MPFITSQRWFRAPLTIHTRDAELPHGAFHSLTRPGAFCRRSQHLSYPLSSACICKTGEGPGFRGARRCSTPTAAARGPQPRARLPQEHPGAELRAGKGPGLRGLRGGSARPALTAAPPPPSPSRARARPAPPEVGRAPARGLLGAVVLAGPRGMPGAVGA